MLKIETEKCSHCGGTYLARTLYHDSGDRHCIVCHQEYKYAVGSGDKALSDFYENGYDNQSNGGKTA